MHINNSSATILYLVLKCCNDDYIALKYVSNNYIYHLQ